MERSSVTARDPLSRGNSDTFDKRLFSFFFRVCLREGFSSKDQGTSEAFSLPPALQGHKFPSLISAPAL